MVRANSAGSHSLKYLRGGPGTFHRVRGDGGPGNSKGSSPTGGDDAHAGSSTLAGLAGSARSCATSADAENTVPENVRREIRFILFGQFGGKRDGDLAGGGPLAATLQCGDEAGAIHRRGIMAERRDEDASGAIFHGP